MLVFPGVEEQVCAAFGLGAQDFDDLGWAMFLWSGLLIMGC